jgi:hypothetical protein
MLIASLIRLPDEPTSDGMLIASLIRPDEPPSDCMLIASLIWLNGR